MITPDEYRYAKAHLRAAIDHLKLAQHYAGESSPEGIDGVIIAVSMVTAKVNLLGAYDGASAQSLKPFVPTPGA